LGAQIRRAERSDAVVIALLGRITFAETFGHLFEKYQEDLRAYLDATFDVAKIERSLCKPENAYWLAVLGRLPVGYAKLKHPSPVPGHAAEPAAQLQKIYLLHAFLGRGIGRTLLDRIMREAAVRAPMLWLDVLRENVHAIGFYKQHGFDAIGEDTYAIGAQSFLFHQMARVVA
jgi:ribosomal protein S18 acetylase RimI-like enzyme